ncbi:hypothetical protein [Enterococcus sp. DIV1059_2]|uniref:hypothetical protein n=1 Tax=Enterococcus sp. DIV1059_2 TaxID=2774664 RepID=UPI003F282B23
MLEGLRLASGTKKFDRFLPATRKDVKEAVAVAHVSANEAAVQIEHIYSVLEANGLKVDRLDDEEVFDMAVSASVNDHALLKDLAKADYENRLAKRKADRLEKKARKAAEKKAVQETKLSNSVKETANVATKTQSLVDEALEAGTAV